MKTNTLTEPLESRIAPAAVAGFFDIDGDIVHITSSVGNSTDLANAVHVVGGKFQTLDLSSATFGGEFDGADITITAQPGAGGGDGHVNLGFLNAAGRDLGVVKINGDLGRIIAGDGDAAAPAVESLTVSSIGALGQTTQDLGGDLKSFLAGALGKLRVAGEVAGEIRLTGTGANLGVATISGPLNHGSLVADGSMSRVKIAGDVVGQGTETGYIRALEIGKLVIGGSVIGGTELLSGGIEALARADSIRIGGSLICASKAGGVENTGFIRGGEFAKIRIGGSIIAEASDFVGIDESGVILAAKLGSVIIGGNLAAGAAPANTQLQNGCIFSESSIGSVAIGGATGKAAHHAGISAQGNIGKVNILGEASYLDIRAGYNSNDLPADADVRIGSITASSWIASNAVVGVDPGPDKLFGTGDDSVAAGGDPAIHSRIGKFIVRGTAIGQADGLDHYGIVAQEIGKARIGTTLLPLTAGLDVVSIGAIIAANGGFTLKELA